MLLDRVRVGRESGCWFVEGSRMLHDLDKATLHAVAAASITGTYGPGSLLHEAGDPISVTFVARGRVKVFRVSPDGKQQTIAILGPRDAFGEIGVLDPGGQDIYVEALDEVEVCRLTRDRFLALMARDPALAVRLAEAMAEKLHDAREQIADLAFRDVRGRVAHLLLTFMQRERRTSGQPHVLRFTLGLTHREVADIVGTRRESVTTQLNALERDGVIAIVGRDVVINDPTRLAEISGVAEP